MLRHNNCILQHGSTFYGIPVSLSLDTTKMQFVHQYTWHSWFSCLYKLHKMWTAHCEKFYYLFFIKLQNAHFPHHLFYPANGCNTWYRCSV